MSYWLANIASSGYDVPDLPEVTFDTVVIGCGISGASAAYHLAIVQPNSKVAVLDRGSISSGATGCNGGFICPGTSEKFSASVDRYGLEATQTMYDYTVKCTELVKQFVKTHKIDCELRFRGCVQLASTQAEFDGLRLSYEQLQSFGQVVEWWDQTVCEERTKSLSYLGGLYKPEAGMLWAARLVHGLVGEAKKLGVHFFTHCPVSKVEVEGGWSYVHTAKGTIKTKNVVYATNAWARELLPELQDLIVPVRNQVRIFYSVCNAQHASSFTCSPIQLIMTEPMPRMWDFSLSCNYGYEYFMQRPDGRILLGENLIVY
jgi:glycine/D-amino acid oxidase-like deaminating enzyme